MKEKKTLKNKWHIHYTHTHIYSFVYSIHHKRAYVYNIMYSLSVYLIRIIYYTCSKCKRDASECDSKAHPIRS